MSGNVRSALVAGLIAFVAYTAIALLTGTGFASAVSVGLLFLVGTAVVTFVITLAFHAIRNNNAAA